MGFIINSPVNIKTGKPSGRSWQAGLKINKQQELKVMQQKVKPLGVPGINIRKLNTNISHISHGDVRPMSALGFTNGDVIEIIEKTEYQEPVKTHDEVKPMSALGFGQRR